MKRSLLGFFIFPLIFSCSNSFFNSNSKKESQIIHLNEEIYRNNLPNVLEKDIFPFSNVQEYSLFVRNFVDSNFEKDISDVYSFFKITKKLPKYTFNKVQNLNFFECEGAEYLYDDNKIISFTSNPSEEMFEKYKNFYKKYYPNFKDVLEERIHYYIKHEAGHYFYDMRSNELNAKNIFKDVNEKNVKQCYLYDVVLEGVAEYISCKGEIPFTAKFIDKDTLLCTDSLNKYYLYSTGFYLVKPILDLNFKRGIDLLIENPLEEKDLSCLKNYQDRILGLMKN
ncbi:MAG: hypothetical protein WC812_03515 [Candidatus Pacearchaeota archaeon]|jgi:hypothetical protein